MEGRPGQRTSGSMRARPIRATARPLAARCVTGLAVAPSSRVLARRPPCAARACQFRAWAGAAQCAASSTARARS
eukprot:3840623-Alexandrium_andersonii.AAC.1